MSFQHTYDVAIDRKETMTPPPCAPGTDVFAMSPPERRKFWKKKRASILRRWNKCPGAPRLRRCKAIAGTLVNASPKRLTYTFLSPTKPSTKRRPCPCRGAQVPNRLPAIWEEITVNPHQCTFQNGNPNVTFRFVRSFK